MRGLMRGIFYGLFQPLAITFLLDAAKSRIARAIKLIAAFDILMASSFRQRRHPARYDARCSIYDE